MAYSLTQFQNTAGPDQLSALDNNITTLSAAAPIPCTAAGTNTLTLTQNAPGMVPSATISAYNTNMLFSAIAVGSNTGPVTATIGTVGTLNVYKDTAAGPVALTGGEIIINNAFTLRYDAALNTGAGGFHLTSSTAAASTAINPTSVQINGGSTITNMLSGNSPTLTFTATPGLSIQDQTFTLTALAAVAASALPAPGDFISINSPSLVSNALFQGYCTTLASLSSTTSVATINVRLANLASASLASNSGIYRWSAMRLTP